VNPEALPDVVAIALEVTNRLESGGIPYVIGGSLASSLHGEPRSTMDVDVVADLSEESIGWLIASLHPDYYVDEDAAWDAVESGGTFNVVHVRAGIKVDFFVAGADAFERERLQKRLAVRLDSAVPQTLWIDTAEHTILRKLEWYRRGGEVSERQWRDVLAIIAVQGEALDRGTLEHWARVLGVSDLLAQGFREH
jgi:hypothetical protein